MDSTGLRAALFLCFDVRVLRASHLLGVMLVASTLMAAACGGDEAPVIHRNMGSGAEPVDDRQDPKQGPGAPNGDGYDPQAPTNTGSRLNTAGFAAVAPIMQAHCSECHHPGTWLDLESGADAATASKMVSTIKAKTMPPAPRAPISAGDLAKIEAWAAGGAAAVAPAQIDPPAGAVTQLLDASTLATYKAALPKVAWTRLAKILASPSTLFWDKAVMPPAYQDTVGDGSSLPYGARLNSTGRSLIVPEGKKLFSGDGETWSFPFGHTAGAEESSNAFIVNFMSLPADGATARRVAYRIETASVQGLPVKRWNWSFPKGTLVGEIIMIKDGSSLVTAEIRVRERHSDSWSTNAFRPFPTATTLSAAVKQKRPAWQTTPTLKALVTALDDATSLSAKRLDSPAFANMVSLEGAVDAPLPDAGDDALMRDLLKTSTFVGAYGTQWKKSGALRTFGPTGPASSLSVVPIKFGLGLLEVRETTCQKCHDQGGTFIGDLVDQAILYGDVWGVDRIFSFHPFEPTRIDASGNENRSVRASLAGVVEAYDAAKHPSAIYSFYRPAKQP